jgi:O-antigen ligase/tetratricopeptide (TPR) repeat protein
MKPQTSLHTAISGRLLPWVPVLALFCAYPLALAAPPSAGVEGRFFLALPVFLWLSLLAAGTLLITPLARLTPCTQPIDAPHRNTAAQGVQALFILVLITVFFSAFRAGHFDFNGTATALGWFAVPLFFAVAPRHLIARHLAAALAILCLINAVHGLIEIVGGREIIGLAANRNWMAVLVLALAPWPVYVVWQRQRRLHRRTNTVRQTRVWIVAAASGTVSLWLAATAQSRAAWLVLLVYFLAFVLFRMLSVRGRLAATVLLIIALAAGWNLASMKMRRLIKEDIRLPLWQSTLQMIGDHPILGVGPGNYRREFPAYRRITQQQRHVAAPVTEHPHNQLLLVSAELGVPLAIVWMLLLTPLLLPPKREPFWRLTHYSAFLLVGAGMFDKTLVQPPDSIVAFILLGLLWRPLIRIRAQPALRPRLMRRLLLPMAALLTAYAVGETMRQAAAGWFYRRGVLTEHQGKLKEAFDSYRTAARIQPAHLRAQIFAARLATRVFHSPQDALPYLETALSQEPDFGHLNDEVAVALEALGKYREALPFRAREAQLFPLDPNALQAYLTAMIRTGQTAHADDTVEALAHARHRLRANEQIPLTQQVNRWLSAVTSGNINAALSAADRLTGASYQGCEPGFLSIAEQEAWPTAFASARFQTADLLYWQRALAWHRLTDTAADPRQLTSLLSVYAEAAHADALPPLLPAEPAVFTAGRYAYSLSELLMQAGFDTAIVRRTDRAESTPLLWVRRKAENWLVEPGIKPRVIAAETMAAVAVEICARSGREDLGNLAIAIPVFPHEFCFRHQALGQILSQQRQDTVPRLGRSPGLRYWEFRHAAVESLETNQPKVTFDPFFFRAAAAGRVDGRAP